MKKSGRFAIAVLCLCTSALCLAPTSGSAAGSTSSIGTLSNWVSGYALTGIGDNGGPQPTPTYWTAATKGQTFRVTGGTVRVTRMEIPLFDRSPEYDPYPSDFQIGVAEWGGARPTGPLLYLSDHLVAYDSTWRNFVVTPSDLVLSEGKDYVLLLTPLNFLDGLQSYADLGFLNYNAYADGHVVLLNTGTSDPTIGTGALFQQDWGTLDAPYAAYDLAFQMTYEVIPEPTPLTLLGVGSLGLAIGRRLRSSGNRMALT